MTELTATERRKARVVEARTGITPGPNSPLLQISGRIERDEDAEEVLCDDLIARITGRSGVVRLSQRRASNITRGVSDRRYRIHGVAFFYEVKAADGKMTATQHAFLLDELQHGALAAVGTFADLEELVQLLARSRSQPWYERGLVLYTHCMGLIQRWAAKGYRHEKMPRTRRGGR